MKLPEYDSDAIHLSRVALPELHRVADEMLSRTREQRMAYGVMHPGRVDVIGGGALIVAVLAEELSQRAGITELVASEHDILDGLALSLLSVG
jgi:exopolyphosphatase/guanosine-5'-triphosphate,3'-diphosphate pyrophosphatase